MLLRYLFSSILTLKGVEAFVPQLPENRGGCITNDCYKWVSKTQGSVFCSAYLRQTKNVYVTSTATKTITATTNAPDVLTTVTLTSLITTTNLISVSTFDPNPTSTVTTTTTITAAAIAGRGFPFLDQAISSACSCLIGNAPTITKTATKAATQTITATFTKPPTTTYTSTATVTKTISSSLTQTVRIPATGTDTATIVATTTVPAGCPKIPPHTAIFNDLPLGPAPSNYQGIDYSLTGQTIIAPDYTPSGNGKALEVEGDIIGSISLFLISSDSSTGFYVSEFLSNYNGNFSYECFSSSCGRGPDVVTGMIPRGQVINSGYASTQETNFIGLVVIIQRAKKKYCQRKISKKMRNASLETRSE
ncbi:hypothetical protein VTL71DRAFT_6302 [Oculimacula yallundae]|uniref:Uncharacterized protein n=1 Tax=Oculimacula yallundae TaxID=86028 RepID=A0ABR4BWN1_9HELO